MNKGLIMQRFITWRLGNKTAKNASYEEIERKKYGDAFSVKQSSFVPFPPLDQIYIPPSRYWVAKANFVITNNIAQTIEKIPGIDFFRPIGPYEFVIAVNEDFFNEYKVMSSINNKLKAVSPKKV